MSTQADQVKLQALSDGLQQTQDNLQTTIDTRQKLEAQQQENKAVQKEFSSLDSESNIYKLVGPILLKQDKTEAVSAVNGRLDFIGKEIARTETKIKELQETSEKQRGEVMQLQQKMQLAAQSEGGVQ